MAKTESKALFAVSTACQGGRGLGGPRKSPRVHGRAGFSVDYGSQLITKLLHDNLFFSQIRETVKATMETFSAWKPRCKAEGRRRRVQR